MISIVVPMYNAERYINKCITSILNQTYSDFELIIVDDGSIDSSLSIVKDYAAKDSRIIIVHKENGGVSSARNEGIRHARGEYICFIDSDDDINVDYLEKSLDKIGQFDLVVSGFNFIKGRKTKKIKLIEREYNKNELNDFIKDGCAGTYIYSVVNKIFKLALVKDLPFSITKSHGEDTDFVLNYLGRCNSIKAIDYQGYNYIINNNSSSLSKVEKFDSRIEAYFDQFNKFEAFNTKNDKTYLDTMGSVFLIQCFSAIINLVKNKKLKKNKKVSSCKRLFNNEEFIKILNSTNPINFKSKLSKFIFKIKSIKIKLFFINLISIVKM